MLLVTVCLLSLPCPVVNHPRAWDPALPHWMFRWQDASDVTVSCVSLSPSTGVGVDLLAVDEPTAYDETDDGSGPSSTVLCVRLSGVGDLQRLCDIISSRVGGYIREQHIVLTVTVSPPQRPLAALLRRSAASPSSLGVVSVVAMALPSSAALRGKALVSTPANTTLLRDCHTLTRVVAAIASGSSHLPYRSSRLTTLLKVMQPCGAPCLCSPTKLVAFPALSSPMFVTLPPPPQWACSMCVCVYDGLLCETARAADVNRLVLVCCRHLQQDVLSSPHCAVTVVSLLPASVAYQAVLQSCLASLEYGAEVTNTEHASLLPTPLSRGVAALLSPSWPCLPLVK